VALTRRVFLAALPLCASGALACSPASQGETPGSAYVELATSKSPSQARGRVLVFMPETTQTREVWASLRDELEQDFDLVAVRVEGKAAVSPIREAMRRHRPSGVVLMNNPTVAAYREYQRTSSGGRFPPAVIVMTSFLEGHTAGVARATGISYEVPLITVVTNLRRIVASPIIRVGVVYRAPLEGFVTRQEKLAAREQIALKRERVSPAPNVSELKRALRRLKSADAIWVLNDDRLLTQQLIVQGWLPGLNERPWLPAIVGAASLVSPGSSFGTFAVLPDHAGLGVQTANRLFDIADNQWSIANEGDTELPLSTTTTVDLTQARERFVLYGDALQKVDRIVE
jgi:hypothetical protein